MDLNMDVLVIKAPGQYYDVWLITNIIVRLQEDKFYTIMVNACEVFNPLRPSDVVWCHRPVAPFTNMV